MVFRLFCLERDIYLTPFCLKRGIFTWTNRSNGIGLYSCRGVTSRNFTVFFLLLTHVGFSIDTNINSRLQQRGRERSGLASTKDTLLSGFRATFKKRLSRTRVKCLLSSLNRFVPFPDEIILSHLRDNHRPIIARTVRVTDETGNRCNRSVNPGGYGLRTIDNLPTGVIFLRLFLREVSLLFKLKDTVKNGHCFQQV